MHNEDIELAKGARLNAWSPYSNFQVGAPKGENPTEKCMPCGYCRQFMRSL